MTFKKYTELGHLCILYPLSWELTDVYESREGQFWEGLWKVSRDRIKHLPYQCEDCDVSLWDDLQPVIATLWVSVFSLVKIRPA